MSIQPFDFSRNPLLVFWETTKACPLSCRHCRASSIPRPLDDELTGEEGLSLINSISDFGQPKPVVVLTGGDCMMRADLLGLVREARTGGLNVAISPAVSDLLDDGRLLELAGLGVKSVSLSLDGSTPEIHDSIRGIEGHFEQTLLAAARLISMGFSVQINTTVMSENVHQLADIVLILKELGIRTWEVFFLITVGRGQEMKELRPEQYEDVCNFLADVTRYGFTVRTVEAPFFRRIVAERRSSGKQVAERSALYSQFSEELRRHLGQPSFDYSGTGLPTRDGKGIIFVAQNGDVYPSGFLPYSVGSVRSQSIRYIYRNSETLIAIREGQFSGKCGVCEYRDVCGGSRARAYSRYGDVLAEDPACIYTPAAMRS